MELAERLKVARKSIGKEQKDIASLLGISFRSWQDYEAGKSVPGGKVFEGLVKLGFNANWLLTGEGEMRQGEVWGTKQLTPEEAARVTKEGLEILGLDREIDPAKEKKAFFMKMIMEAMPIMSYEDQEKVFNIVAELVTGKKSGTP